MVIDMKRNPIDWSGGSVIDTSALDLTKQQKYDIGIDNEKLQNKTLRKRSKRRTHITIQHGANARTD